MRARRVRINPQVEFDFRPSNLQITNEYFARYEAISEILDRNPEIISLVHRDLEEALTATHDDGRGGKCKYTSDTVLRILICHVVEGESLRGTVVRIDDSGYLRRFTRIHNGPMLDYTHLGRLKNCIQPKTWKKINDALAQYAVSEKQITGERLRIDTTAFETNIHYPTDSSLLWDVYRVIAREIERLREIAPSLVENRHLQTKSVKKLALRISRAANRKDRKPEELKPLYVRILAHVDSILSWADELATRLRGKGKGAAVRGFEHVAEWLETQRGLGLRVVDQARRRVLHGESVPNDEKLFSIFEEHTELLKRGKAGKEIEFGHMISIEQVEGKFVTGYDVFGKRPEDSSLVEPALDRHRARFGHDPSLLAADKAYYGGAENLEAIRQRIDTVSIPKRGGRNEEETAHEHSFAFKLGQQFRAGVEGTISFLKRALGMSRCLNKGWQHYQATVGATILVHNLLVLARGFG